MKKVWKKIKWLFHVEKIDTTTKEYKTMISETHAGIRKAK
jgi:hypothetical protein